VLGLAALPALLLTGVVTGPALVLICSLFIFLYFANQPVFTGLIADYSPPGAVGRSFGISFFAGFGLGSTGGVIAVRWWTAGTRRRPSLGCLRSWRCQWCSASCCGRWRRDGRAAK
jgi:hypothetical protein